MKVKRNIVNINEELCNGCGHCVKACHESALQIIDGKARLVSEIYCDGLGACIGDCPMGAITIEEREVEAFDEEAVKERLASESGNLSELTHWPVQLHLINPLSAVFKEADLVLAADCTAYAYAGFHSKLLKNKKLAIACPKLDSNKESYINKLVLMIDNANIKSLTIVIMEVPCCGGLLQIAKMALERASRKIPVNKIVISTKGSRL